MTREEELEKQITEQGDKIRKLKAEAVKKVCIIIGIIYAHALLIGRN